MSDPERAAPWLFVVVGLAMVAVAALNHLPPSVAVAFAVVGAGLLVVGGCLRLLEGTLKLGPQGVEATLRKQRAQEIIEAVQEVAPDAEPLVREVIRSVDWGEPSVLVFAHHGGAADRPEADSVRDRLRRAAEHARERGKPWPSEPTDDPPPPS